MAQLSQSNLSEQVNKLKKNLKLFKDPITKFRDLSAKDFLHGRMGPWPQPSPAHPIGEAPAVLHLPLGEVIDWWVFIGSRYLTTTLFYTPIAYIKAILHPGLDAVSDAEFLDMLQNSMLAKFICPNLDEKDKEIFKSLLNKNIKAFIIDFEPVNVVTAFPGIYCTGTKTLLKEESPGRYSVLAVWVDSTNEMLTSIDGDSWELAKYFVLQGGALCSTLVIHPILHFPLDSINAITKTALPTEHLLFKLIYPHLRFTLPLENAVLTYKSSLLQGKWWMPYAPYPSSPRGGLRDLLVQGYMGIAGNDSYPAYRYSMRPDKVWAPYGEFQDQYYSLFYNFVSEIVKDIEKDDYFVSSWAKWISQNVPGFPNEKEIFEKDHLASAVAYFLWGISVGHTVDHYSYGQMNVKKIPLRLRQAPPRKGEKILSRKNLVTFWDTAKYMMAQKLFYQPTSVTLLKDTTYSFEKKTHQDGVEKFIKELQNLDAKLEKEGIQYVPLNKIARGIQS
jgi:hypothetical protein